MVNSSVFYHKTCYLAYFEAWFTMEIHSFSWSWDFESLGSNFGIPSWRFCICS